MLITNYGAFRHSQREEPQSAVSGGSCNQRENETDTAVRAHAKRKAFCSVLDQEFIHHLE